MFHVLSVYDRYHKTLPVLHAHILVRALQWPLIIILDTAIFNLI